MNCYIDKFKSKYKLDDICRDLLSFLSYKSLSDIVEENSILRLKCNLLKKTYMINLPREKVENGIVDLYKTNEKLKMSISKKWEFKIANVSNKVKDLKLGDIEKILEKDKELNSLFEYATFLWSKNEEAFNQLGDKAYEMYLSQKNTFKNGKEGVNKVDKNILDTSLGQILEAFNSEKVEKHQELEETIKQNSEEIKKLSKQMKIIIEFNKDIKKMLNSMTETIKTLEKETNNNQSNMTDKLSLIDEEVKEVSKEIKQINKAKEKSEQTYKKDVNTISCNIKGVSDSLKNQNKMLEKLEMVKKDLKEELVNISKKINNLKVEKVTVSKIVKEKDTAAEEKVLKKPHVVEVNKTNVVDKEKNNLEDSTFGELLEDLLKDK